jgi:hypothetical protein
VGWGGGRSRIDDIAGRPWQNHQTGSEVEVFVVDRHSQIEGSCRTGRRHRKQIDPLPFGTGPQRQVDELLLLFSGNRHLGQ